MVALLPLAEADLTTASLNIMIVAGREIQVLIRPGLCGAIIQVQPVVRARHGAMVHHHPAE